MVMGSTPLILHLKRIIVERAWKLPIEIGKVPFKVTLEREMVSILPYVGDRSVESHVTPENRKQTIINNVSFFACNKY